jgi:hypothetical protein
MVVLMNSNFLLAAAFALVLATGLFIGRYARADDHHQFHRDFYRTWQQPDNLGSCCDARISWPSGAETGDCEPTTAKLIAGRWYAQMPNGGAFIEVPAGKIIRQFNPSRDGTDGHLCFTPQRGVLCFVPPAGTM